MKTSFCKSLPVAMYHYVNEYAGSITLSPSRFEEHCRALARNGWRGIGLAEAEAFLMHGEPLPRRSLLMTFDDGFLDNYLYALPLLHTYGHKAVIFAVSDRLEKDGQPRAKITDVLEGRAQVPEHVRIPVEAGPRGFALRRDVFLNHAEARLLDGQDIMAVASHSRGHYGVYAGPEYTGFTQPGRQLRTFYRTEEGPVFGLPGFAVKPGLLHRAFIPNPALVEAVCKLVPQDFSGAADFFAQGDNLRALESLARSFAGDMGRFESDDERRERMWREIAGGKAELEAILGHGVQTLCWPWGRYSPEALALAGDAGFRLFFTTREGANPPGRPGAVRRFKAKDKDGDWLLRRAAIYSRPLLGSLYAKMRL